MQLMLNLLARTLCVLWRHQRPSKPASRQLALKLHLKLHARNSRIFASLRSFLMLH
ncbi:hypothetical protein UUU_33440 [Klebsiella pneumoniae subsp. pneumoniae DSM 30104 = JCM 1662 = NBRC 14940]|nr:hypothetical protein UUU_33440 [Klebsiella pneumoniae subsp. pneumoniae DSM 30104 = JCM 1662 = NBRC 14940]